MELFSLFGTIGLNGAEEVKKDLDGVNDKAESVGKKSSAFDKFKGAMERATPASKVLLASVAGIGVAAGAFITNGIKLAGELEQNIGGASAVYGEYADELVTKSKTAYTEMGLSQGEYLQTANLMGSLFKGSGFEAEKAMDMTSAAMQRASDVASIMGIDTSMAMESIAGAAKGNFTMMDNLGVAMNDTTLNAYALEKGIGKSTREMTNAEKVGLAMEMFLDRTSFAAGNYAKENDTFAGSLTTLKANFANVSATIGEKFLPILTDVFNKFNGFLENDPFGKLQELAPVFTIVGGAILVGIVPALASMAGAAILAVAPLVPFLAIGAALGAAVYYLSDVVGGLGNALLIIAPIFGTITALMIAYKIQQALAAAGTTLWAVVSGTATGATTALGAAFAFLTSPIALVILAIAAVIAIGILLYKHWDEVKTFAINAWEAIKNVITTVITAIKTVITTAWNAIKTVTATVFNAIKTVIKTYIDGWKFIISNVINVIKALFSGDLSGAVAIVKNIFAKIKDGISEKLQSARDVVKNIIDKIKGFFNFSWSLPKLKLPHVKISGSFSLSPPKVPSFGIDWYAKGGIMTEPTAFGINGNNLMVGGEAGAEAIAPISTLRQYVREEMYAVQGNTEALLVELIGVVKTYLPEMANMQLVTDTGALVGAIAPQMDSKLGQIYKARGRGSA